ncbi:hypothetical protein [Pelagerythrobacter sp.]|uniref:hypothetical protein n=1 Tax=Pelagerythrobacter sp. TaxID=2800702 RepID=UPI0035B30285
MKYLPAPAISLLAVPLLLAACGDPGPSSEAAPDTAPEAPAPLPETPAPAPSADMPDDGSPDLTPAELVPEAEKGEAGARNVLLSFARAIELKEFGQAYAMLSDAQRQNTTRAEFARMFDGFGEITVAVPGGTSEGAAGSIYYEVPTTITGSNGQTLTGTTVLRRVNDVPGATAEQLRWHLDRFDVAPG